MTKCLQCQADARDDQKFCGNCGCKLADFALVIPLTVEEVKALIVAEMKALTKDSKVVEYETSIAVVDRVSGWAKLFATFLGVPVALGLGVLALFGINSYENFVSKISTTQKAITDELSSKRQDAIRTTNESADKIKAEAKAQMDKLASMRKETIDTGVQRSREIRTEIDQLAASATTLKAKLSVQEKLYAEVKQLNESVRRIEKLLTATQLEHIRQLENLFEFGDTKPDYSLVTPAMTGDSGGITFGYVAAQRSSRLRTLLLNYLGRTDAKLAKEFEKYRALIQAVDAKLDTDEQFISLLRESGNDPVMRLLQDEMFAEMYINPAFREANELGIRSALGIAVIVDSMIHGSWSRMRDVTTSELRGTPVSGVDEKIWVRGYAKRRLSWLGNSSRPDLRKTTYRMEALISLMDAGNWDLSPPITINGKTFGR